jgi:hypothetical protein
VRLGNILSIGSSANLGQRNIEAQTPQLTGHGISISYSKCSHISSRSYITILKSYLETLNSHLGLTMAMIRYPRLDRAAKREDSRDRDGEAYGGYFACGKSVVKAKNVVLKPAIALGRRRCG